MKNAKAYVIVAVTAVVLTFVSIEVAKHVEKAYPESNDSFGFERHDKPCTADSFKCEQ